MSLVEGLIRHEMRLVAERDASIRTSEPSPSDQRRGGVVNVQPLLALEGIDFLTAARHAILGNAGTPGGPQPEPPSSEPGKIAHLRALRASPEGLAFGTTLIGVPVRSRYEALFGLSLIGTPLRWAASLLRVTTMAQDISKLHDTVLTLQHIIEDQQISLDTCRTELSNLHARFDPAPGPQSLATPQIRLQSPQRQVDRTQAVKSPTPAPPFETG